MKRCIGDDRLVTDPEIHEALTHREIVDYIEREYHRLEGGQE